MSELVRTDRARELTLVEFKALANEPNSQWYDAPREWLENPNVVFRFDVIMPEQPNKADSGDGS
jgi:hypothetical protein